MSKNIFIFLPQKTVGMSAMLIKELCWVASSRNYQEETSQSYPKENNQVKLVSLSGKPVTCFSGNQISVDAKLDEIQDADSLFIGAFWGEPKKVLEENHPFISLLQAIHKENIPIAAVSNGPFFLAEAGLLENKHATVYPPLAALFQQMYPNVDLRYERAITDAGLLFCANGIASGCDLTVAIIERLYGHGIGNSIRKDFLLGFNRNYSLVSATFEGQKYHHDQQILASQQWLEHNFYREIKLETLAADIGLSVRHFSRRFKQATGDNPSHYLQRVRVEVAKELLSSTKLSKSEIADRVGYSDVSYFYRIFKKYQGCSPQDYI